MKNVFVYILFSRAINRFYIGITSEQVEDRLRKHNQSTYGNHYTSKTTDWEAKLELLCENYTQARKIELYIKRMKSRKYILALLEDKTEPEKLLMKFKDVPQKKNSLV